MPDLTAGLDTAALLEETPPHVRVTWIAWDSPFRTTDLRVGDRIVAINGVRVTCPVELPDRQRMLDTMIGGVNESVGWTTRGVAAGSLVSLTVRRHATTSGWTELTVTAPLGEAAAYRDANNRIVLGDGGPDVMTSDDFPESWGGWYDNKMRAALGRALDPEQRTGTFVTRFEWAQLGAQGDRVTYAAEHYDGPWSRALKADYDAARAACEGAPIALAAGALDFRRRGEELAAEVRAKGQAAWVAAKASVAPDTIPAFPAINPVRGDARPVVDKYVVLGPLGNADWVSDAGHGWFAAGSADDGWYFLDAESEAAETMLRARQRYGRMVDPNVNAQFEFVARITSDSRLVVVGQRAHFGLVAVPVTALIGDAMFVDMRTHNGVQALFAGEEAMVDNDPQLPSPEASPATVLNALIDAIKLGDLELWRALHADWSIERNDTGKLTVYPHANPPDDSSFEESRRSMNGRVLDVRIAWVDDPVVIADRSRFPGAMHIEEVAAQLDHVGSFDGETRVFADVTVRRNWRLQRVDGGPWRIATVQAI